MNSRRHFIKTVGSQAQPCVSPGKGIVRQLMAQPAPSLLDPNVIPKFATPLLIPPVMPKAGTIVQRGGKNIDYYEISMGQTTQQILPGGFRQTTVWGYGAVASASHRGLLLHNAPSLTIGTGNLRIGPRHRAGSCRSLAGAYPELKETGGIHAGQEIFRPALQIRGH